MTKRDIGAEIIAGLKELRDSPGSLKRYEFAPADVKSIREQFEMSQKQFANFLMISVYNAPFRFWIDWACGVQKEV